MPGVAVHPLADLVGFYHNSVGANGHLEIDFAIDRTGNVDPVHAAAYASFGAWIRACYGGAPVAAGSLAPGATVLTLAIPPGAVFDRIVLEEDQTAGQAIAAYATEALVGGRWLAFSSGISIGAKRIDIAAAPVNGASSLRVTILSGYAAPTGLRASLFAPDGCAIA